VLAAFDGTNADPLGRLREEGEPAAKSVRDNLDRLQPGLGNPVMKVEVRDVPVDHATEIPLEDPRELQEALARIAERLNRLERHLEAR
jgi:hypothetical protein